MPLFGNKFSPKKGAPRKYPSLSNLDLDSNKRETEFGLEPGPIKLSLGGNEISFEGGEWISDTGSGGGNYHREATKLRKENQALQEENNLMKVKIELLLDMLSERTAEIHLQENEIDQLKRLSKKR